MHGEEMNNWEMAMSLSHAMFPVCSVFWGPSKSSLPALISMRVTFSKYNFLTSFVYRAEPIQFPTESNLLFKYCNWVCDLNENSCWIVPECVFFTWNPFDIYIPIFLNLICFLHLVYVSLFSSSASRLIQH